MAIPHHHWTVYSRSKRHNSKKASAYTSRSAWGGEKAGTPERPYSAIAAAAYVSRSKTWDRRYTTAQDYSRKKDLAWSLILAPAHAPSWVYDRQKLWTAVEEREDLSNRKETAQLFRGTVVALPRELTLEQNIKLITSYIQNEYVDHGMIADICIHDPDAKDGEKQPHAHVMLTMRDIGPDGFGNKRRDWNDVDFGNKDGGKHHRAKAIKGGFLDQRRKSWADYVNAALADAGSASRIDHRTLEAQGKPFLPSVTMGKAQHANDNYEFVRKKKARAEETNAYNADLVSNLYPTIFKLVTGFLEGEAIGGPAGGAIGLAEAAIGQMLPNAASILGSIPRAVVGALHGRL